MLKVIYSEKISAQEIMDRDKEMLDSIKRDDAPILHFYSWNSPSATYGYFIDPRKHLNLHNCEKLEIDLARRPTGGGIVFHLWDWAFSFILPVSHPRFSSDTLDNYFFVNSQALLAIKDFLKKRRGKEEEPFSIFSVDKFESGKPSYNFCMATPTKYDVIVEGKKAVGAAQRRTKEGYLHQGTISLFLPDPFILNQLLLDSKVAQLMLLNTFSLLSNKEKSFDLEVNNLKALLISYFEKSLST
jgi:lipoate---protein ligase